jgi:hypothetical protein
MAVNAAKSLLRFSSTANEEDDGDGEYDGEDIL